MAKAGQARVLSKAQFHRVLEFIEAHRHPEKNALIMQISFKLGLRVQEISLLRLREVISIDLSFPNGYKIKDVLVLPKNFTKGARATEVSNQSYQRKSVRFSLKEFDNLIKRVKKHAETGKDHPPEYYYPKVKKPTGGKTRELPLVDTGLCEAIKRYVDLRFLKNPNLRPNDPLILNQKGLPYSPNTLQDHMSHMLKNWAGIERASSHSGRRSLATTLIHDQGEHIKTVQQILGHKDASTTVIYHELPETEVAKVLKESGNFYNKD